MATKTQSKLQHALRLGLRASLSACEHPGDFHEQGAKRGCGACRAVVALREALKELPTTGNEAAAPTLTISKYQDTRFWGVWDGEELVCVTVYQKGAREVKRRLERRSDGST